MKLISYTNHVLRRPQTAVVKVTGLTIADMLSGLGQFRNGISPTELPKTTATIS